MDFQPDNENCNANGHEDDDDVVESLQEAYSDIIFNSRVGKKVTYYPVISLVMMMIMVMMEIVMIAVAIVFIMLAQVIRRTHTVASWYA